MSLVTEEIKAKAEVYHGHDLCKEKSQELLREVGLPNGLLPMREIEECGIVRETGFVWLKQRKSITHKFEKIGKPVSYATEVTAVAEPNRIKKLTGVKAKELLLWITLCEISVDPGSADVTPSPSSSPEKKITFKTPAGLSRQYPVSAFVVEEEEKAKPTPPPLAKEAPKTEEAKEVNGGSVVVKEV